MRTLFVGATAPSRAPEPCGTARRAMSNDWPLGGTLPDLAYSNPYTRYDMRLRVTMAAAIVSAILCGNILCLQPAWAYESTIKPPPIDPRTWSKPRQLTPDEMAPPGDCLGFGKVVVETLNSQAQKALEVVSAVKSSKEVLADILIATYISIRGGSDPSIFDNDYHIKMGHKIPGLQPDTAVVGAGLETVRGPNGIEMRSRKIPAVSLSKGVTTFTQAIVAARANSPEDFNKCFPSWVELEKNYDAKVAEVNQKRREAAKQAAEAEAERQSPRGQVTQAYAVYRLVRYCNEVRRGYLVQYVNDDELARAATAIQAVVQKAKHDEPSIDTDVLWNNSADLAKNRPVGVEICQSYLRDLLRMSPVAVYDNSKPVER
jgi:hypothetical protein